MTPQKFNTDGYSCSALVFAGGKKRPARLEVWLTYFVGAQAGVRGRRFAADAAPSDAARSMIAGLPEGATPEPTPEGRAQMRAQVRADFPSLLLVA